MQKRPKLGEILVTAGIITPAQLVSALEEQRRWGQRLGITLMKLGMVEEGHLVRALAKQLGLPVASLAGKLIPEDVIALVPARLASQHGVIPLFVKAGRPNGKLFLGMEDPSNLAVLDDLSFRTGMEVHPVMVGPTELGRAIDRYYRSDATGAPQTDPFKLGDTLDGSSLRRVTDDSPQPGTTPYEALAESEESRAMPTDAEAIAKTYAIELDGALAPEDFAVDEQANRTPRSSFGAASESSRSVAPLRVDAETTQSSLEPHVTYTLESTGDDADEVARLVDEAPAAAVAVKAIAALLVEKGLLEIDDLRARVAQYAASSDDPLDLLPE